MDWLNEGVGLLVVIFSVIIILLLAVTLVTLFVLRNKIASQRLNFLGIYSADAVTRSRYAELTVGNRSLNEVVLTEIGVRNGKVSYNLTALYKEKNHLGEDARIVVEQRSSISFTLMQDELLSLLVDGKKGGGLKTLRLYAIDVTGNLYKGTVKPVKKLLAELKKSRPAAEKTAPQLFEENAVSQEPPADSLVESPAEPSAPEED